MRTPLFTDFVIFILKYKYITSSKRYEDLGETRAANQNLAFLETLLP
jgi:hypothetical protein